MATDVEPKRSPSEDVEEAAVSDAPQPRPFKEAAMPVFACGAGLFSDGYINNVSASECLLCYATCPLRAANSVSPPWAWLADSSVGHRFGQHPPRHAVRRNIHQFDRIAERLRHRLRRHRRRPAAVRLPVRPLVPRQLAPRLHNHPHRLHRPSSRLLL